jgi:hypothetical protein
MGTYAAVAGIVSSGDDLKCGEAMHGFCAHTIFHKWGCWDPWQSWAYPLWTGWLPLTFFFFFFVALVLNSGSTP